MLLIRVGGTEDGRVTDTPRVDVGLAATETTDGAATPDWVETREWVDALRDVARSRGPERASDLLQTLQIAAQRLGVTLPVTSRTPYVNTIPLEIEPRYPGNIQI